MTVASKIGDWTFKAFTAGLGMATIYMTGTFSLNLYRGVSWHNKQKKEGILQKPEPEEESSNQNSK